MNTGLTIRQALPEDASLLRQLSIDSFVETYAIHNTAENMDMHLSEKFGASAILDELSEPDNHIAIAFYGNEPAGYVKLRATSHEQDPLAENPVEIERIYVLRQFQHMRIGAALMAYSIGYARQHGFDVVWLGVWEKNEKARLFYDRWGFKHFGNHIFMLGEDRQTDLLVRLVISG